MRRLGLPQPALGAVRPAAGATLVRHHPHARGLIAAYLFTEGGGMRANDYAQGAHATIQSGTALWDGVMGVPCRHFTRTGVGTGAFITAAVDRSKHYPRTRGFTAILRWRMLGANLLNQIGVNVENGYRLVAGDASATTHAIRFGPAGWGTVISGGPTLVPDRTYDLGAAWDGANVYLLVDGVVVRTVAAAGSMSVSSDLVIGNNVSGGSFGLNGAFAHLYLYDGYKSPEEIRAINADPYAMFAMPGGGTAALIPGYSAEVQLGLLPSGDLTSAIPLSGAAQLGLAVSGPLTTQIRLDANVAAGLTLAAGRLRVAKFGSPLKKCGHPLMQTCSSWLFAGE